nr:phage protease [uncultured Pseudomonas sp.]
MNTFRRALNSERQPQATGQGATLIALNTDLSAQPQTEGAAPEWVELIPAGPAITGRDGRFWLFDELSQGLVVDAFTTRGIDLAVDWEHASEIKAPNGEPAPAAGWIDQLEIREGALWGHVQWTPRGGAQIAAKEYRFLSPVFDYDPTSLRIGRLVSLGLTNKPNLFLTALNHEQPTPESTDVKISAALLALLGLPETATEEQAVTAATQLKATATAKNSEQPSLDRYVPRADYDALTARAANAEQALATHQKAQHTATVDAEIQAALTAGKITPATADYHRAACSEQGGLDRFRAFVAAAPVVGDTSGLENRKPNEATATALNAEQQAVCAQFGMDPVEFAKTLKSQEA